MFDLNELTYHLKRAKVEYEVGPSNIQQSPYHYVFIHLTDEKHEGPHIIISDPREDSSEDGYIVGAFTHYEGEQEGVEVVQTVQQVLVRVGFFIRQFAVGLEHLAT